MAASVPGIVALIAIPYVLFKVYPPEIKKTPEARDMADNVLKEMGPMSRAEKIMLVVFVMLIGLWATAQYTKLDGTLIAFMGLCILLATNVLTWNHVIKETRAWDTLVWVGSVIALSDYLNKLGFISWFAKILENQMVGVGMLTAVVLSFVIYLYSHIFASMSAHVTAYFPHVRRADYAGRSCWRAAVYFGLCCGDCLQHLWLPDPFWHRASAGIFRCGLCGPKDMVAAGLFGFTHAYCYLVGRRRCLVESVGVLVKAVG